HQYLDTFREMYREGYTDYRGTRVGEEQATISEYASLEADDFFDRYVMGAMALGALTAPEETEETVTHALVEPESIHLYESPEAPSLLDMKNAWRQLWTAFSVGTHRLARDSEFF